MIKYGQSTHLFAQSFPLAHYFIYGLLNDNLILIKAEIININTERQFMFIRNNLFIYPCRALS